MTLQYVGGDHLGSYRRHPDHYIVVMCIVLCFALAKPLVHMPDAAYSIPKISELLRHGLQC